MVGEREQERDAGAGRRTAGQLERRRGLADASVGMLPGESSAVGRFQVIIYLCSAPNTDVSGLLEEARAYAEAFRWEVVAEIEDRHGLGHPEDREGLTRVIERIERREAGAVLTPWRSMISPIPEEFAEVSRQIEQWGAFLQVTDSDRARVRAAQ